MSELLDAKLIIRKKGTKYITEIYINGKNEPFSRYKFTDDKFNGKDCKIDKLRTKIYIEGKVYPPVEQAYSTINNNTNTMEENNMPDSFDIGKTKLPKDIREDLKDHIKDIDNFALKLNKAARVEFNREKNKDEFKFYNVDRKDKNKSFCIIPNFGTLNFPDFKIKMEQIKTSFESQGYTLTEPITRTTDWRLIVGLGNESVYETSMTLHHIYGIPYIPGSAVKGITRSYVITVVLGDGFPSEKFKDIEKLIELDKKSFEDTYKTNENLVAKLGERSNENPDPQRMEISIENFKIVRKIFGNQNQQGKVIFFDAFPTEAPTIEPDIMNCHYDKYYQGKTPPADYLSPNPIFFLTVNATFDFYLGIKQKDNKDKDDPLDTAEKWLNQALTEHGIGAKTAVGYGYFT